MRQIREPTDTAHPATTDEAAIAVQGGQAYVAAIARRLAPYFARVEPRQRAMV
jgi:hypothetical protein